jgi:ABC-type amino acid transport substrate-binding protein
MPKPNRAGYLVSHLLFLASLTAAAAPLPGPSLPAPDTKPRSGSLPDVVASPKWTGDFDGMEKRRRMRVLVPYSKTLYFVDKGQQRGLAYDAFTLFETDYNKKRPKGTLPFHAVFVPIARGDMVQALIDGRGDVAMGYITVTPERRAMVDFTEPTAKNVSEIVVTGPGQPAVASKEDLSGREVYLRKDSSYFKSVEELNADLKKAGKPRTSSRWSTRASCRQPSWTTSARSSGGRCLPRSSSTRRRRCGAAASSPG